MSKHHANKGIKRNKKPLQNYIYRVDIVDCIPNCIDVSEYDQFKFKELGYLVLYWGYEKLDIKPKRLHGYITPGNLKSIIGDKQWQKFCQGKREFIIQRRVNNKNI